MSISFETILLTTNDIGTNLFLRFSCRVNLLLIVSLPLLSSTSRLRRSRIIKSIKEIMLGDEHDEVDNLGLIFISERHQPVPSPRGDARARAQGVDRTFSITHQ